MTFDNPQCVRCRARLGQEIIPFHGQKKGNGGLFLYDDLCPCPARFNKNKCVCGDDGHYKFRDLRRIKCLTVHGRKPSI